MEVRFVIQGDPVAKGRPKFSTQNGFARAYTPQKTESYENLVKLYFLMQTTLEKPMELPLEVKIVAKFPILKGTSKKKEKLMLSGTIFPTKKPDLDNIAKVVTDALNGIAYKDDSQIVVMKLAKVYAEQSCVEVTIKELEFSV